MPLHLLRAIAAGALAVVVAACGAGGAPGAGSGSAAPSATAASAAPATFDDFATGLCGAFTSLVRAVGNPDAGTPSVLSKALDDAVKAGDGSAADRAAIAMLTELEAGRADAARAGRWQPAAATMAQMDRLLVAYEASTAAKQAVANHTAGAVEPGTAFEQAGGSRAWTALGQGLATIAMPAGASPRPCPAMSGQV